MSGRIGFAGTPLSMKKGKRTLAWEAERKKLKAQFELWGITECEVRYPGICWRYNCLGFAHAKKRRFLKPEDLGHVVLACNPCHDVLESLGHTEMQKKVDGIIAARKKSCKKTLDLKKQLAQLFNCA